MAGLYWQAGWISFTINIIIIIVRLILKLFILTNLLMQRLAKNTLINALRYSALSPIPSPATQRKADSCCADTVSALVSGAEEGWQLLEKIFAMASSSSHNAANIEGSIDELAGVLNK